MKVKLTSHCNKKGCEGSPGDIVDVTDAKLAKQIIEGGGGVEHKPAKKDDPKKD